VSVVLFEAPGKLLIIEIRASKAIFCWSPIELLEAALETSVEML
jgi:hypothetical protein